MSQLDMQGKQKVEQSGTVVIEKKPSRPLTDSDEKSSIEQDPLTANKPGLDDDTNKLPKTKSSKRVSSTKLSKHGSKIEKTGSIINKENTPESIPMATQDTAQKKTTIPAQLSQITPVKPIPTLDEEKSFQGMPSDVGKQDGELAEDDKSMDKISELRTKPKHSEWSDDEEAGGLPRSESRSSRVSRAVRQFFCCGLPCEAQDEDYVSHERLPAI